MKFSRRDRRALWVLAAAVVVILAWHFSLSEEPQPAVAAAENAIPLAEKQLARLRRQAASFEAHEKALQAAAEAQTEREKGMIQADTAAQAQAQLLQIFRRVAGAQSPPVEIRTVEMGQVRPLGEDYGEILVPVTFSCRIEQLVNLLAELTAQPELLATSELRVAAAEPKEKALTVRLTISGVAPRRLVPEQKGAASL